MNRVIIGAFIGVTFFLCAHRPASAMAEFCPATLKIHAVGQSEDDTGPAALYGFELTALGSRTITSATLAFDTNAGWYTVTVPATTLAQKVRHYTSPVVSFTRLDYVSPVLYVRFPQPVRIAHAWVSRASAQGDGAFGWQAQGTVTCDPPPTASAEQERQMRNRRADRDKLDPSLDPKDRDQLSAFPTATSLLLAAQVSTALETVNCPDPFRDATVRDQARPHYPAVNVPISAKTHVAVAIQPDGTLLDAWVWEPSGISAFDTESVKAAKNSTYIGARAYCRPVPGTYFFNVIFDPN